MSCLLGESILLREPGSRRYCCPVWTGTREASVLVAYRFRVVAKNVACSAIFIVPVGSTPHNSFDVRLDAALKEAAFFRQPLLFRRIVGVLPRRHRGTDGFLQFRGPHSNAFAKQFDVFGREVRRSKRIVELIVG